MSIDEGAFEELKDSIRLEVPEAESTALRSDLNALLQSVEALVQLDLSGVEPWQPRPSNTPPRADVTAASLPLDVALGLAPRARDGYFEVPRTLDDD